MKLLTAELRRQFRVPKEAEGVVVTKVAGDSPAGSLGIEPGDVIMSIDQQPARTPQQAAAALKQAVTLLISEACDTPLHLALQRSVLQRKPAL